MKSEPEISIQSKIIRNTREEKMMISNAFIFGILTGVSLILSFILDRDKTILGVKKGRKMFFNILHPFLNILILISIVLFVIPDSLIVHCLGVNSGWYGFGIAAFIGSIILVPGFIAYPLAATLLKQGATYAAVAVFMTTIMTVGIVTLPLEIKYFGKKAALLRNLFNLVAAIVIGIFNGVVDVKKHLKNYIWVILFVIFSICSYLIEFKPGLVVCSNFNEFFIEMMSFIPFLFVIIGLFDVWLSKEVLEKHIGRGSGVKGIFIVIPLAMFQAGPLYGAFPVAYILYKKGASVRNIFIYLGAFSSMKLPMLGLEIGYLGIKFTFLRTLISLPLFTCIGFIMEKILGSNFKVEEVKA